MVQEFVFINLWQTKQERQDKYLLARMMGASSYLAMRMRDWRLAKIERYYAIDRQDYHNREQHDSNLTQHLIGSQPALI